MGPTSNIVLLNSNFRWGGPAGNSAWYGGLLEQAGQRQVPMAQTNSWRSKRKVDMPDTHHDACWSKHVCPLHACACCSDNLASKTTQPDGHWGDDIFIAAPGELHLCCAHHY